MKRLQEKIEAVLNGCSGRWAVAVQDLTGGGRLEINPDMSFPSASMIKVPILYEIARRAANGSLSIDDRLSVSAAAQVGGAGILKELRPGITLTVGELATLMIVLSDNTATNILIDLAGMDQVNRTMAEIGLHNTVLRRNMMDFTAAKAGRENQTTAADLADIFDRIYHARGLPAEYGAWMMDILKRQQDRTKLPFYWPEETEFAGKTGMLTGVEHDGGILFLANKAFFICVLSADLTANQEGVLATAAIGQAVFAGIQGGTLL